MAPGKRSERTVYTMSKEEKLIAMALIAAGIVVGFVAWSYASPYLGGVKSLGSAAA